MEPAFEFDKKYMVHVVDPRNEGKSFKKENMIFKGADETHLRFYSMLKEKMEVIPRADILYCEEM
jgi:hypothetical protein